MIERIFTFGARRRLATFLLLGGVSLAAVPGLLRLQVDTSYDSLMQPKDPAFLAYQNTIEEFGSDKATILYFSDPALFTPARLRRLEELTHTLLGLPGVDRVESLFTVLNIRDRGQGLTTGPIFETTPEDPEAIAAGRSDALANPMLLNNLISADGNTTAITVTLRGGPRDPHLYETFYETLESLLIPLRPEFQQVFQIGPPRINAQIQRSIFSDIRYLTPLATVILMGTVFLFLSSGSGAVGPMLTAALSVLWTFGFMGYCGIPISLLTAILPCLMIVIGSTEDIHMLTEYFHELGKDPKRDKQRAIRQMARRVGLPVILTSSTTALGFFANVLNDVTLIQNFAYASSAAMVFSFIVTFLLIPWVASLLPAGVLQRIPAHPRKPGGLVGAVMRAVEEVTTRHRRLLVGGTAIGIATFAALGCRVHLQNDPLSFFKPKHPVVQDAGTLHQHLAGMYIFYLTLEADAPGGFYEPEHLRQLQAVGEAALELGFDKTISLADVIALVHRQMNAGDPAFHRIPDRRDLIEQYLLLFQRADLERYLSGDAKKANMIVRHHFSDSAKLKRKLTQLREAAARIAGPALTCRLSGESLLIHEAADSLAMGSVQSLGLLVGAVFLIMSVMYTSALGGILSLIPNLIPIIINFGTMTLLGIPLNVGTAMVSAIAIGIAVDDTMHLLSRYNAERKQTSDPEAALRTTLWSEAVPVISTSVALTLGFSVLMSSQFAVVAQFGLLSALTMISALLADLTITPLLLRQMRLVSLWEVVGLKVGRQVLSRSPLFAGMSPFQIKKAILLSELREVPQGQTIIVQGSKARSMSMVLSGTVEVLRVSGGREERICTLGAGEVFGEVGFTQEIERTATVRTVSEVLLLGLDFASVQKSLRWYPGIASRLNLNISRILGERLARMHDRAAQPETA